MIELKHISGFKKVLENYQPSEEAIEALKGLKLVALVAPTSAGRNTIIGALLKTGKYHFIVSDTTRPPRINDGKLEQNGLVYWFRKEEDFLNDLKSGKYLEAEIIHNQQVSGMSIRALKTAHAENKIAITDLDIGGVNNVMNAKSDTIAILVLPPNFREWQRRISTRGQMSDDELTRRLQTAERIFSKALLNPNIIFVINDNLPETIQKIKKIVENNQINSEEQQRAQILVKDLHKETANFLKSDSSTLDE